MTTKDKAARESTAVSLPYIDRGDPDQRWAIRLRSGTGACVRHFDSEREAAGFALGIPAPSSRKARPDG